MMDVAARHGFHFDTVQMPLNVMDAHFRSFEKLVLPRLVQEKTGVLGMKSMGDSIILKSNIVKPIECLHYAMNLPTSVVITGIDSQEILQQAFEAAHTFKHMSAQYVDALIKPLAGRLRLSTPVQAVTRHADHVLVKAPGAEPERFDDHSRKREWPDLDSARDRHRWSRRGLDDDRRQHMLFRLRNGRHRSC